MRAIVPEDLSDHSQRRSMMRAITSMALGTVRHTSAESILRRAWPNDARAGLALATISKGAVSPLMTTDAPALGVQGVKMLTRLAPRSAALQLFDDVMSVDLSGLATVRVPNVAVVAPAAFVAEGSPGPVAQYMLAAGVLGPLRKVFDPVRRDGRIGKGEPRNGERDHWQVARSERLEGHRCRRLQRRSRDRSGPRRLAQWRCWFDADDGRRLRGDGR